MGPYVSGEGFSVPTIELERVSASEAEALIQLARLIRGGVGVRAAKVPALLDERSVQPGERVVKQAVVPIVEFRDYEAVLVHPRHYVMKLRTAGHQLKQRQLEQHKLGLSEHLRC